MRKLKANEIECRVAQVFSTGCTLLLYKTARVDRAILTESYGNKWQNDFKLINGNMYGGIGIKIGDEWIWRWDCGTESFTEKEKGQASDCFKRAGFKWGIGIELYSAPRIYITTPTIKEEKSNKTVYKLADPYIKFSVKSIDYDENGDIKTLVIADNKNKEVFHFGTNQKPQPQITVNPDEKIINALKEMLTSESAYQFYKANENKVKDSEAFKEVYKQVYSKLKKQETQND